MHDLVVRDRQHVVLGVGIHHREGDLVLMEAAVDRIATEVTERVVHPAHVPLQPEPEPAEVNRPGYARPRGGLLGDHRDAGDPPVAGGIDLAQERHRVQVLPAAERVRRPLARLARVVEVEHRGDGVDPQPVRVELLQPVDGVRDQEVAHLRASEVEDQCAPVRLLAALRVGMLVQRRAVELRQRPAVPREVRGHPVQDHPDAGPVQAVDQVAELVRRAEPGGWRVVGGHLVAPGAAERVLGNRQELHVGEAQLGDVAGELAGELGVGQAGPPRAEMHLIGAHRAGQQIPVGSLLKPGGVAPGVPGLGDTGRGSGRLLRPAGHRVGLAAPDAIRAADVVLVAGAVADAGNQQLPDA